MRTIKYLSPTSIMKWRADKELFYLNYLAEDRPPRQPQTKPMSVGSAFDAYIKSHIYNVLELDNDGDFDFEVLFASQVDEHNRVFAREAGKIVFDAYMRSGALADLMLQLSCCFEEPIFEFTVHGTLEKHGVKGDVGGVTLLGKPDAYFTTLDGAKIILDWKVNGYCAKKMVSPKPGYLKIRDGSGQSSKNNNSMHKDCIPVLVKGILINGMTWMEDVNSDWAIQLAIYAWLCGEEVGSDFVVYIDQICCGGGIRVAQHRCCIGKKFQEALYAEIEEIWDIVHSGYIFRELTEELSVQRCNVLDGKAAGLRIPVGGTTEALRF